MEECFENSVKGFWENALTETPDGSGLKVRVNLTLTLTLTVIVTLTLNG